MLSQKKVTALLPMKANSERVIGKNFKNFCGKPLYRWILDKLIRIDSIENIIINTDAYKILEKNSFPNNKKIIINHRPKELCGDFVSMNKIIEYDLKNSSADYFLMTHTTNPLISESTISKSVETFFDNLCQNDSLFSANKIHSRFYNQNANPINHDPNNLIRTQDLEPYFEENSCMYIFSKESFQKTKARIGANPKMQITPRIESIDIDDKDDWFIAESIQQSMIRRNQ